MKTKKCRKTKIGAKAPRGVVIGVPIYSNCQGHHMSTQEQI